MKFPTRTNLSRAGYKYRSSDNYVSTYWWQSETTGISVSDFIEYYQNFDILLEAEQIEIEEIEVDEQPLIDKAKDFFEKMSLCDPEYEKSDSGYGTMPIALLIFKKCKSQMLKMQLIPIAFF